MQCILLTTTGASAGPVAGGSGLQKSISNISEDAKKNLPSFWVPCQTPKAAATKVKKPVCTCAIIYYYVYDVTF